MADYLCHSEEETIALGIRIGKTLSKNSIVCFFGDLGAGKTTFIKGLTFGCAEYPSEQVNSPTFVYLNIYNGNKTIFHFDLYRLKDSDEFLSMGFDEMLYMGGVCFIEWSEKIANILPPHVIKVTMKHLGENKRKIEWVFA